MKNFAFILALLIPLSSCADEPKPKASKNGEPVSASERTAETIRKAISDMPIKAVNTSPIPGLYELVVGDNIYYSDATGTHVINGHMFDMRTKNDLTAQRLASITRINWSALPMDKAIVSGPEDGLKMAVFTDPDCPYCKRLEDQLSKLDGIRVYTFLFPLTQLHPDAYAKSESIWCAKDQAKALHDVMINGTALPKADCKTPVADLMALGKEMNVMGTPTIFAEDGRKFAGGVPLDQIKEWLKQGS